MTKNVCPKCKKEVNENELRCPHCNTRLKQACPTCGTLNPFGTEICSNCQTVLLKYCENCGSANLPTSVVCRKCSAPLVSPKNNEEAQIKFFIHPQEEIKKQPSLFQRYENETQNTKPVAEQPVEVTEYEQPLPVNEEIEYTAPVEEETEQEIEYTTPTEEEITEEVIPAEEEPEEAEYTVPDEEETEEEIEYEAPEEEIPEETVISAEKEPQEAEYAAPAEETEEKVVPEPVKTPELFEEIEEPLEYKPAYIEEDLSEVVCVDSSDEMLSYLNNIMQNPNNAVISGICAEEGMGKSTVLKSFTENLSSQGIIPIIAENSELLKVSPYGTIRDALLKLLSLPDMHPDIEAFYSDNTKQLFVQNFETLSEQEILNFMNFLYPAMQGNFKDILENKKRTNDLLEKIFNSIVTKNNAVFIIDNFDLTDNASFDFIQNMINKGLINNKTKLFITYREKRPSRVYFDKNIKNQDIFSTIYLNNLNNEQTLNLIRGFSNSKDIPENVFAEITENGRGNIFFTEQYLSMLFDAGYMFISSNMMKFKEEEPIPFSPKNTDQVIQCRFETITQPEIKDSLIAASIMGYKFDKTAFAMVTDITPEQADNILKNLTDLMFVQPVSELEYTFKNMTTWSVIFDEAQKDERFNIICKKVYNVFCNFALSNPIVKATVAKYQDDNKLALKTWKETAQISAFFGDENIYALSLEQFLLQTGYKENTEELTDIQKETMEKIGKIVYRTNPQKAVKYLTLPITIAKEEENALKVISLGSYLIKACYLASDYNGVIETIDLIIKSAENELSPLDKALILSKKLEALFKTGNCEEGINLGNNDIISKLEEALSKENDENLAHSLFNAWFESSVAMIKLYALQGNSKSVEIADNTEEIMQMNGIQNPLYTVKLNLAKAFALTVIGKIKDSEKILKTLEDMPEFDNKEFISQKNLIFAMNLVFSDRTENLREILFNFAKYADDANDKVGKHIFKLILAWQTSQEGEFAKANMIFNDELTFFAQEKIVTGALISWMFIAQNTLMTETEDSIQSAENTAMKALEVAQNPKFSQYHIAVYLQKLIAEINLLKGDGAAAKMYLEKGMLIAKQFGLDLAQIELYRTFAQFLGYSMSLPDSNVPVIADKANKIYQAAIFAADKLSISGLTDKIQKEKQDFTNYCQQNGIALKN